VHRIGCRSGSPPAKRFRSCDKSWPRDGSVRPRARLRGVRCLTQASRLRKASTLSCQIKPLVIAGSRAWTAVLRAGWCHRASKQGRRRRRAPAGRAAAVCRRPVCGRSACDDRRGYSDRIAGAGGTRRPRGREHGAAASGRAVLRLLRSFRDRDPAHCAQLRVECGLRGIRYAREHEREQGIFWRRTASHLGT
jgi:hypothetical protein